MGRLEGQTSQVKRSLREAYRRHAVERDSVVKQDWKVRERDRFLQNLKTRKLSTLLEIGAGTGADSQFFAQHGFDVTATDMTREMVELCRRKGLRAEQVDFYDLHFPHESFDAVWSLNCLLHVPKAELGHVLTGIRDVLKPGGLFYFGVYGGQDSEGVWEDDSYEPKRFFSFYTDDDIQKAVREFFTIRYFSPVDYGHDTLHFQSLILQK